MLRTRLDPLPKPDIGTYIGPLGGWKEDGVLQFYTEINAQIDQAFVNVDTCLKDAGGKGWSQVYRVNSYHVPINDEALD